MNRFFKGMDLRGRETSQIASLGGLIWQRFTLSRRPIILIWSTGYPFCIVSYPKRPMASSFLHRQLSFLVSGLSFWHRLLSKKANGLILFAPSVILFGQRVILFTPSVIQKGQWPHPFGTVCYPFWSTSYLFCTVGYPKRSMASSLLHRPLSLILRWLSKKVNALSFLHREL